MSDFYCHGGVRSLTQMLQHWLLSLDDVAQEAFK